MEEFKVTLQRVATHNATIHIMANDAEDAEAKANEMLSANDRSIDWSFADVKSESVIAVARTIFRYWLVGVFYESGVSDQSLIHDNKYFNLSVTPSQTGWGITARNYDDAILTLNGKDITAIACMSARSTADLCGKLDDLNIYIIDETGHIIAKESSDKAGYFDKV